jgi:hypothetical protein
VAHRDYKGMMVHRVIKDHKGIKERDIRDLKDLKDFKDGKEEDRLVFKEHKDLQVQGILAV